MSMHLHKWKCGSPESEIIVIAEVTLGPHYAAASSYRFIARFRILPQNRHLSKGSLMP